MKNPLNMIVVLLIKFYKAAISPFFPNSCRFYPTCSGYAMESFQKHGFFKAFWLSAKRVSKCHPFHEGGFDPVPEPNNLKKYVKE